MFHQDFSSWDFPRFLQGPYLKTALTLLPQNAKKRVWVMVPYLIQSETLNCLINLREEIEVILLTRDHSGYLPNIKSGAQPAINKLRERNNIQIYINNDIHAKILLIDNDFAIIHSMNGTPRSENKNFEAGVVIVNQSVISETYEFFDFVKSKSTVLK